VTIKKIKDFLKKLFITTKAYKEKHLTLDLVFLLIDYILTQFKKAKKAYQDDSIIILMFNFG
jgi:hypothetical protein